MSETWEVGPCEMPGALEIRSGGETVAIVGQDCPHVHLIASAPDLYAALAAFVDAEDTHPEDGVNWADIVAASRAALARAREPAADVRRK